jgi:hypothetical protein
MIATCPRCNYVTALRSQPGGSVSFDWPDEFSPCVVIRERKKVSKKVTDWSCPDFEAEIARAVGR